MGLTFGGIIHSNTKQISLSKLAMLGQCLLVLRNFEISKVGLDQVEGTVLPLLLFKDL